MRKMIRKAGLIILSCLLITPVTLFAASEPPATQDQVIGDARLSLIQGDVVLQTEETGSEWGAAVINTPLLPGTKLWAPETGRSEIQFFGGSYLRMDSNTELNIADLRMDDSGHVIQVEVPKGRVYIHYVGSQVPNSVFQIDTPITSIVSDEPSRFDVTVNENGHTEVTVFNGSIDVQSQNGSTRVNEGMMLEIDSNQTAETSPMRSEDAWLRWNFSRDSALANTGPSKNYLPSSLGAYGNDFDTYGHWVNNPAYGHVWTPSNIPADWAPYRIGRWCWIGGDYVWVSYEPWGWVPYHYGRWAFVNDFGWCWVPPMRTARVSWCPGYVAWIQTPTFISWVPLAPGEIYYGHRYYGPHSVNIKNVNINHIRITHVYVNSHVAHSVTVVSHETFLTGRHVRVANAPANPFHSGLKVSPGRPDIRPVKATSLPDPARVVSERALPPKELQTKVKSFQHRTPAVGKDDSVFHPGKSIQSPRVEKIDRPQPATSVRRPEVIQPPERKEGVAEQLQREEKHKTPLRREEVKMPTIQRLETNRPSVSGTIIPPNQKRELTGPMKKLQTNNFSEKRREVAPPEEKQETPLRREEVKRPTIQRQETNRPSVSGTVIPPNQKREPTEPMKKLQTNNFSEKRREVAPPTVRRETRAVPSFSEKPGLHSRNRSEMNPSFNRPEVEKPSIRNGVKPPVQKSENPRSSVRR